jgi:Lhr-like helicase
MLKHPPEILITTPESLNILLTSQSGRDILTEVKSVILDEIHAIIGEKRGTHCITAIERLCRLAGEFQRIGISATIRPMERAAAFLGGRYPDIPPDPTIPTLYSAGSPTAPGEGLGGERPVKILGRRNR